MAQRSDAASALAQMTSRLGAGEDALSKTVRRRQNLIEYWQSTDKDLIAELSNPADKRNPDREARLRASIKKTSAELKVLDGKLSEEFPRYEELSNPQPLSSEAARQLLGSDEALVVYDNFAGCCGMVSGW